MEQYAYEDEIREIKQEKTSNKDYTKLQYKKFRLGCASINNNQSVRISKVSVDHKVSSYLELYQPLRKTFYRQQDGTKHCLVHSFANRAHEAGYEALAKIISEHGVLMFTERYKCNKAHGDECLIRELNNLIWNHSQMKNKIVKNVKTLADISANGYTDKPIATEIEFDYSSICRHKFLVYKDMLIDPEKDYVLKLTVDNLNKIGGEGAKFVRFVRPHVLLDDNKMKKKRKRGSRKRKQYQQELEDAPNGSNWSKKSKNG